jgi:tetratricopeptide (TPR) repeat protein
VLRAGRDVPQTGSSASNKPADKPGTTRSNSQWTGLTPERAAIAQKAFSKGMQLYKESNFSKAIEFFEAAIQNNDAEAIYYTRLASALMQARKSATRAIDASQKAIELDPYNVAHKFVLASIFEAIGSKSNACKVYEEILRWDEGNIQARSALAALNGKKMGGFSRGKGANPSRPGLLSQLLDRFRK